MSTSEDRQKKQRRPIAGRQVYYQSEADGIRVAIITDVHQPGRMDSDLSLLVLYRGKTDSVIWAPYGKPDEHGRWWWID